MNEKRGLSWRKRAVLLAFISLVAVAIVQGQDEQKSKVTVVVTQDDSPCFAAKVVIRPRGDSDRKAKEKSEVVLITDLSGKAQTTLAPGRYRITAVDSIQNKIPALAYFEVKAGQSKPMKIRLSLIYWDCAHVTCEL